MTQFNRRAFLTRAAAPFAAALAAPAWAREAPDSFSNGELVSNGHRFFGSVSRGLATGIENATRRWGRPNAYILGQEGSGAFIGGLRFGEGRMYTRNAGDRTVYWQGPSLGFDAGADGDRTMMLVYNLPDVDAIYQRFAGMDGSAYLIGGFRLHGAQRRRCRAGADPFGRRAAPRRELRLSEIHAALDLEPVLRPAGVLPKPAARAK